MARVIQRHSSLNSALFTFCSVFAVPQKSMAEGVGEGALMGAAIQPKVLINGEEVGKAVPKGFFYVDRPPGNYEIVTSTEVKRKLSLTLNKGQTRYVRLNVSMGFFVGHVYPELIDNEEGEAEIQNCRYIGKEL